MKYYLITVWGDVEPQKSGPYESEEARDKAARDHRHSDSDFKDGLYKLNIDDLDPNWDSRVYIDSFGGKELDDDRT